MERIHPTPMFAFPRCQIDKFEKHMPYGALGFQDVAPVTGNVVAEAIVPLCEKIGQPVILRIHAASARYLEPLLKARTDLFTVVVNLEQAFITSNNEQATVDAFLALLDSRPFLSVYAD